MSLCCAFTVDGRAGPPPAVGGGALPLFGASMIPGSPFTRFLVPGNTGMAPTAIREACLSRPGTLTSLCVEIDGPAAAGAQVLTYTVMLNGVATLVTVPIVVTATQGFVLGFGIALIVGDRLGLRVTKSGGHPAITGISALVGVA